jgi:hypothetical protein
VDPSHYTGGTGKSYFQLDQTWRSVPFQERTPGMTVLTRSSHSFKYRAVPFFIFFLVILLSTPCFSQTLHESPDQVWTVGDRQWSIEEEHQFGRWVEENITEDFFIRYKIPTDCADVVYGIRWIYARINHLPAASTTRDGKLIGHWSTDWKDLPTDPEWYLDTRFRAALLYILKETWTGTLPFDTYPIRISPDSVMPGTLFFVKQSHAGLIGHVFLDGSQVHPLQIWEATLPVKVQKLSLRSFFCAKPESGDRSGLVKFRWPVFESGEWRYLPPQEHPFYSEEQYTSDFLLGHSDFVEAVAKRIDPTDYPPMEKMVKVMGTITRLLRERVPMVLAGYEECRKWSCPEGSDLWEIHSTHGLDGMILLLMDHLSRVIEVNHLDKKMTEEMMEAIPIAISKNRSVTFYHVYQNYLWLSSHPEDSIEARWGLEKCRMILAQTRSAKNSIAFIEKTYRKRDPKYADFSIRQQQYVLRRLDEEWTGSECRELPPRPEEKARFSPHPKRLIDARWGSKNCGKIRAEIRATHDSIAFIEKTYRKKDPEYADFSIRQQQHLLQRLNEEWTESQCK